MEVFNETNTSHGIHFSAGEHADRQPDILGQCVSALKFTAEVIGFAAFVAVLLSPLLLGDFPQ